ncbi:MAG: tripartite tricarboxylate transporter substrate binding protein [Burkholderiales bacterium]|jgi:tripartite-type tricarboxylate transporter receptor subunit TctC|nr:tripartite tricarboxylate transporter substrate binding protein [Burkholderiales bacterium]
MTIKTTVTGVMLATCVTAAGAQSFPNQPVRILVGFGAGGSTDIVARTLAQSLTTDWKQNVLVENRPGASGMIAAEMVAKAAPDGHTLMITPQTSLAVAPALFGKAPYDTMRDFTPITQIGYTPLLMVVHPSFPPRNFKEFLALARKTKEPITFGSGGIGSSPHMAGELMAAQLGIKITHVPYKGENPALTDTIGGQIPIMFGNLPVAVPHVNNGRLRGLANTWSTRSVLAKDIPTVAESGFKDYAIATWFGLLGPGNMPAELSSRIQRDTARVLNVPATREKLTGMGVDLVLDTPEQFREYLRSEVARYAKVIRDAGIKGE